MKKFDRQEILGSLSALKDNAKAVIAIAVLLLALDGAFLLRGQFVSIVRMFAQAGKLKKEIKEARANTGVAGSYKTTLEGLEKELAVLNKKVIGEEELPRALETISKFADMSSVRILRMKPMLEAPAPAARGARQPAAKPQSPYVRQKVSVTMNSSFHQLGRFIALLENSPVFFDIRQMEIRADEQAYTKQFVTIILEVVIKKT